MPAGWSRACGSPICSTPATRWSWPAATTRQGADELVFLDITASSDHRRTMVDVVSRTAEVVFIPFTVGGGVRSVEDARLLLRAGADKVGVNTAAVDRPELVAELADEFGSQCVVVAVDARRRPPADGPGGRAGLGGVHPRGADRHRARRPRMVRAVCRHRRRRDPAHLDGPGRHPRRVRPGPHRAGRRTLPGAGDRLGRGRHPRPPGGGCRWRAGRAVLAASIFHLGEFTVGQAKDHLSAAGVPVRPGHGETRRGPPTGPIRPLR